MDIYREEILDHYKNPRGFGDLEDKTHEASDTNASCGDMMEVYLKIDGGVVKKAGFRGVGCALSTAMTSMLMEEVVGKKVSEVEKWNDKKLEELIGEINPARVRCVELPLEALKKALVSKKGN